jgi:hypothetical protein
MRKSRIWDEKNGSSAEESASGGDGMWGSGVGGIVRNSRERRRRGFTRKLEIGGNNENFSLVSIAFFLGWWKKLRIFTQFVFFKKNRPSLLGVGR